MLEGAGADMDKNCRKPFEFRKSQKIMPELSLVVPGCAGSEEEEVMGGRWRLYETAVP